jgi:phytoene dehydrogenase-like protein
VCACYLARAGLDVVVLEQSDKPGGGSRTDETVPGYRFDTHSVAHNIINMTSIPAELDLAGAGLEYREMDPFAVAFFADGRRARFHRSVEQTVDSIAELDSAEAAAYRRFIDDAMPLIDAATLGFEVGRFDRRALAGAVARRIPALAHAVPRALRLNALLLGSYGRVIEDRLCSEITRGPISAFAAHAGAGPEAAGGAFFALWQAAYHRYGQWHAVGGAQGLVAALVRRLATFGGELRCDARVMRIEAAGGAAAGVALESGERIAADLVVTACQPQRALLELLDPPLGGRPGEELRAVQVGNAVQALVHVAVDRLPPYTGARPGDWNGLQSYVDALDDVRASFRAADDRRLRRPAAAYAFTTSALDDTLAPAGHHTVYLACPAAPFELEGGWEQGAAELADDLLDQVEMRAPGFRASIKGMAVRTPPEMATELDWPGAHPMHVDIGLDQLGPLRPTRALASHRTPVAGLYVTGAGTSPAGGIAGAPGRAAARAVLKDVRRPDTRAGTPGPRARCGRARSA